MRPFAVLAVVMIMLLPASGDKPQSQPQERTGEDHKPADPSAVTVVINQPPSKPQTEVPPTYAQYSAPIWSNWALVFVAACAAFAAIKTLRAIEAQVTEMRSTGKQTDKLIEENIAQSASMELSVKEAGRLAGAMEVVSQQIAVSAEAARESVGALRDQMRAYISVSIGGAVYQERAKNLRFQGKPVLINSGFTPAHKVRHKSNAAILPIPLPQDFGYPLPETDLGASLIGPRQQAVLSPIVDGFVADEEVEDIKAGKGKALYVWGLVEYEDVFKRKQETRFCQVLTWLQDGTVWGYFIPGHNDGT